MLRFMELFKYMPYRETFFETLLLGFTALSNANDPFEGAIQITSISDCLSKSGAFPEASKSLADKKKVNPHPYLCALSLSKSKHSLLMWAHYAKNHEGIILGLDTSHPFFNQKIKPNTPNEDTSFYGKVLPVTYDRVRPKFKFEIRGSFNFSEAILTKSDEWMYEKEYRMFMRKSDCDEFGKDKDGKILNHVFLFKIPPGSIKRIIIGERLDHKKVISDFKIAKIKSPDLSHVIIEKAELHKDLYHIEHRKLETD